VATLGVYDRHGDGRQVYLWEQVNAERLVGEQTDDTEAQNEHRRKDRTADAYLS